jgi:hypothetical protein
MFYKTKLKLHNVRNKQLELQHDFSIITKSGILKKLGPFSLVLILSLVIISGH